jgi:phage N-6-adenine-methyltransferase
MNTAVLFSSKSDEWQTPPEIFDPLNAEFGFVTDVAANEANHRCETWLGPGGSFYDALADGLYWGRGPCWCNPPYTRGLQGRFIAKAAAEARNGATVVMLLPARTDTKAFHAHIWNQYEHTPREGVEVRFLNGRVRFVGAPSSAPFPSMVVVFGRKP